MTDFIICIPSYKRHTIIADKTLKCLESIDKSIIKIFVVEEEYYLYQEATQGKYEIIVGEKGLINQRNFIENYFPQGTHIVFLDDDISSIDLSIQFPLGINLADFFRLAFEETISRQAFIWSVYPVFNPFFREKRQPITEGLVTCIGAFYGIINRPNDNDLKLKMIEFNDNKEDVERSILYYKKDGKTIRFNQVGFQTKYYGKVGGMGTLKERMPDIIIATQKMNELYEEYGKLHIRKNGIHEFKLRPLKPFTITDKTITILPEIPTELCQDIYNQLLSVTIPFKSEKSNNSRQGFGKHRSATFGIVRKKFTGKVEFSSMTLKYPELYQKLIDFGEIVCGNFLFTSIQVNHNVTSPKHKDKGNNGKSILISVGEYSGSNLGVVVNDIQHIYNTNCKPIMFDGSLLEHFNTNDLQGNKFSLIFFNHSLC